MPVPFMLVTLLRGQHQGLADAGQARRLGSCSSATRWPRPWKRSRTSAWWKRWSAARSSGQTAPPPH